MTDEQKNSNLIKSLYLDKKSIAFSVQQVKGQGELKAVKIVEYSQDLRSNLLEEEEFVFVDY